MRSPYLSVILSIPQSRLPISICSFLENTSLVLPFTSKGMSNVIPIAINDHTTTSLRFSMVALLYITVVSFLIRLLCAFIIRSKIGRKPLSQNTNRFSALSMGIPSISVTKSMAFLERRSPWNKRERCPSPVHFPLSWAFQATFLYSSVRENTTSSTPKSGTRCVECSQESAIQSSAAVEAMLEARFFACAREATRPQIAPCCAYESRAMQ